MIDCLGRPCVTGSQSGRVHLDLLRGLLASSVRFRDVGLADLRLHAHSLVVILEPVVIRSRSHGRGSRVASRRVPEGPLLRARLAGLQALAAILDRLPHLVHRHHPVRIRDPEVHARGPEHVGGGFPRGVDVLCRDPGQQRKPLPDVLAIRVELPALLLVVHDVAEGLGVDHAAREELPAQSIALQVGVDESVPKVLEPPLPRQVEVLDEEVADEHPQPVVAPARGPELLHARVDKRVARAPLLPALEEVLVVLPRDGAQVLQQRPLVRERVVEERVPRVFPVPELLHEHVDALELLLVVGHGAQVNLHLLQEEVDARDGDLAVVQVGRHLGRAVRVHHRLLGLEEGQLDAKEGVPGQGGRVSSWNPVLLEVVARLRFLLRENLHVLHRRPVSLDALVHFRHRDGSGQGHERLVGHPAHQVVPELVKCAERLALLVHHLPGLVHEVGPEGLHVNIHALQQHPYPLVSHERDGVVEVVEEDRLYVVLLHERDDRLLRRGGVEEHQPRSQALEFVTERLQGLEEPPPARESWREDALLLWRPDEEGHDFPPCPAGGHKRRVVVEPEVSPEPDGDATELRVRTHGARTESARSVVVHVRRGRVDASSSRCSACG
mmetsp:Transcript_5164/g.9231  ORF Transcript_5164/g.9231 Transcript_5164/m.9231 type:complete len:611 (+) Transcript_5164:80-1912(+)